MQQVTDKIVVLSPGEQIPPQTNDAIKMMFIGSEDMSGLPAYDWQGKFIEGLQQLTDPNKGLIMYKNLNFVILNPKAPVQNPQPTYDNQEFHSKINWVIDNLNNVDVVICNFLKRSQSPFPLFYFGYLAQSQKMVVRCPDEYPMSGLVKIMCEKLSIPLLQGKTTVKDVMLCASSFVQKFKDMDKYQLPD